MVKQMIGDYILDDNDLNEYVEGIIENEGDYMVYTTAYLGDEEQIENMKIMTSADEIQKYAEDNSLFFLERVVMSKSNGYDIDFADKRVGDVFYYDGNGELGDLYSDKTAVVVIDDMQLAKDDKFNIQKNRKEIIASYCSSNYFQCKLSLQNVLQGMYKIEK